MRIFLDTEFTNLEKPELISIGAVDEQGQDFYGERNDFDRALCSSFVDKVVIPLLGRYPDKQYSTASRLRDEFLAYLNKVKDDHGVIIGYDDYRDWELLDDLLGNRMPTWVKGENVRFDLNENDRSFYFTSTGLPEHHAFYDAYALRSAYHPADESDN